MSLKSEIELLRVNNQLCYFSTNGKFLAVAFQTNLIIKDTKSFNTIRSFVFPDLIEFIEWSPNNEYILCANIKKCIIQAYSINFPQWKFKLIEGSAALESVTWSPSSKHILILAEFNIQVSIWSLENRSMSYIQNLKSSAINKLMFSPKGDRLALIITDNGQETVDIYKTSNWKISRKLICERLKSISGICWSPDNDLLCIWCSFTNEPKLIIYSTLEEKNISVFCPSRNTGLLDTCNSTEELKGIENIKWIPSGQLLAVTGYNEMVVLLNHITWRPILQLYLEPVIHNNNYLSKVYKERIIRSKDCSRFSNFHSKHIIEEENERPLNIQIGKIDTNNKFLIAKVDVLEFSTCGRYLAIKHQLYPGTLWIWDIISDYVDYLLLQSPIIAIKWNPVYSQLLVFCELSHVYEWTPEKATCMSTPGGITILDGRWHCEGKILLLCGYNKAVVCQIDTL